MKFNFSSSLNMSMVTCEYIGVEDVNGESKTRFHPVPLHTYSSVTLFGYILV